MKSCVEVNGVKASIIYLSYKTYGLIGSGFMTQYQLPYRKSFSNLVLMERCKEGIFLFKTICLWFYGIGHMVNDHSDREETCCHHYMG